MPLSALLTSILKQASEPLHCLHGAGYFTPDEWIKLDLIMNKKYTWTNGPSTFLPNAAKKVIDLENETSSFFAGVNKDLSSSDATSLCASEPVTSDIITSPASPDPHCTYSLASESPKLLELRTSDRCELKNLLLNREQELAGHINTQHDESKSSNLFSRETLSEYSTPVRDFDENLLPTYGPKSISAWTSEVQNNPFNQSNNRQASNLSDSLPHSPKISSPSSRPSELDKLSDRHQSEVDKFETSNAAEWDEENLMLHKASTKKEDLSVLIEEKFEKIANYIHQTRPNKPMTRPQVPLFPSHMATRSKTRVLDIPRMTRHKDSKDRKTSKDCELGPKPKARVCWFWAESPGGCRYRSEDCINLHMKPMQNLLPKNSLSEIRSTNGNFMNEGCRGANSLTKPKTCWYWAKSGICGKGTECKNVHGWVMGGVASCPQDSNCEELLVELFDGDEEMDTEAQANQRAEIRNLELGGLEINDSISSNTASEPNLKPQTGHATCRYNIPEYFT